MKYVDANVFVYPVIYDESKVKEARLAKRVLLRIAKGEIEACTASLTWDELVWVVRRFCGASMAEEEGRRFLRFPNLKILGVNGVLEEAQRVLERYGLRPRDAIHVACALKNRVREIVSDDEELDKIKELKRIRLQDLG